MRDFTQLFCTAFGAISLVILWCSASQVNTYQLYPNMNNASSRNHRQPVEKLNTSVFTGPRKSSKFKSAVEKTPPHTTKRAIRLPNMDNTMYYIIGAIHSTVQNFLFQLQTLIQIAFFVLAGLGLRSYFNRSASPDDTATSRVLQLDTVSDPAPSNQFNRFGNFNVNDPNRLNNFNRNNFPNGIQNGFNNGGFPSFNV